MSAPRRNGRSSRCCHDPLHPHAPPVSQYLPGLWDEPESTTKAASPEPHSSLVSGRGERSAVVLLHLEGFAIDSSYHWRGRVPCGHSDRGVLGPRCGLHMAAL